VGLAFFVMFKENGVSISLLFFDRKFFVSASFRQKKHVLILNCFYAKNTERPRVWYLLVPWFLYEGSIRYEMQLF
jgi:hypothetical protein